MPSPRRMDSRLLLLLANGESGYAFHLGRTYTATPPLYQLPAGAGV
jgi:hypothetical protein